MPNNWKTYKLGNILAEKGYIRGPFGSALKRGEMVDEGIPVYEQQQAIYHTRAFRYFITPEKFEKLKRFQVKTNDIIISCSGTVGRISIINEEDPKGIISQALLILRPNIEIISTEYLYQYLRSPKGFRSLTNASYGSVQANIANRKIVEAIDIKLPELPEQKAIANILSAIDDKIENNLAINKTLEDMAMALYKHWFVDFGPFQNGEFINSELGPIPKGWEVKRLDEVAFKFSKTYDFKDKDKVVFVNTGDVQNGSFLHSNYSDIDGLPGQAKKVIEPNDILYSEIRPKNKRYAYVDFDSSEYVVSTKFMIIRNNEKINNRLLYRILTRQDTIDQFQMIAESRSGTFPQITFDVIGHFQIALPSIEIQNKFQSLIEPFEQKQSNNLKENQSLIQLRDTLLPKLISGEVRLKEFQNQMEAVL